MPPPSWDISTPCPASRGSMYCSCASSTCNWPSRVRACRAKMSRMSWVRSMTRRLDDLFDIALLGRTEVVIEQQNIGIHRGRRARDFLKLACSDQGRWIGPVAALQDLAHDFGPGTFGQGAAVLPGTRRHRTQEYCAVLGGNLAALGNRTAASRAAARRAAAACAGTVLFRGFDDVQAHQERALTFDSWRTDLVPRGTRPAGTRRVAGFLAMRTSQAEKALSFGARSRRCRGSGNASRRRFLRMRRMSDMRRGHSSHHHGRDGVLEDELLLTVRLQHHGVLVKRADAAR